MNEEFKELYNYLKSNGITDLDENAFYQAYSSPEASKEVFDYVKSQDMTDLDESSFYSSYFGGDVKKKDESEVTSEVEGTVLPTEQVQDEITLSESSQANDLSVEEVTPSYTNDSYLNVRGPSIEGQGGPVFEEDLPIPTQEKDIVTSETSLDLDDMLSNFKKENGFDKKVDLSEFENYKKSYYSDMDIIAQEEAQYKQDNPLYIAPVVDNTGGLAQGLQIENSNIASAEQEAATPLANAERHNRVVDAGVALGGEKNALSNPDILWRMRDGEDGLADYFRNHRQNYDLKGSSESEAIEYLESIRNKVVDEAVNNKRGDIIKKAKDSDSPKEYLDDFAFDLITKNASAEDLKLINHLVKVNKKIKDTQKLIEEDPKNIENKIKLKELLDSRLKMGVSKDIWLDSNGNVVGKEESSQSSTKTFRDEVDFLNKFFSGSDKEKLVDRIVDLDSKRAFLEDKLSKIKEKESGEQGTDGYFTNAGSRFSVLGKELEQTNAKLTAAKKYYITEQDPSETKGNFFKSFADYFVEGIGMSEGAIQTGQEDVQDFISSASGMDIIRSKDEVRAEGTATEFVAEVGAQILPVLGEFYVSGGVISMSKIPSMYASITKGVSSLGNKYSRLKGVTDVTASTLKKLAPYIEQGLTFEGAGMSFTSGIVEEGVERFFSKQLIDKLTKQGFLGKAKRIGAKSIAIGTSETASAMWENGGDIEKKELAANYLLGIVFGLLPGNLSGSGSFEKKILEYETNDPSVNSIKENIIAINEAKKSGDKSQIDALNSISEELKKKTLEEVGLDIKETPVTKEVTSKKPIAYNKSEVSETEDANVFVTAQGEAIAGRKEDALQVTKLTEEDAQKIVDEGGKLFMTSDGKAGAYVAADGYMGGLFKNPNANRKEAAKVLQEARVKAGGKFFDAFGINSETGEGTNLEDIYVKNGFRPVARMPFNEEFAPEGWEKTNLAKKPDNVFFVYDPKGSYKIGDGIATSNYDEAYDLAKNDGVKVEEVKTVDATITKDNSSNFANMTEDEGGNFVFFHRGKKGYKTIKPSAGQTRATSREEASAVGKVGGVAMFYTDEADAEQAVTGESQYAVKIPKEKVYDFNSDSLNFIKEAKERHNEEHPGKAFDANTQLAYVTKIAGENGFDMVVAEWGGKTRAQSTQELSPVDSREYNGNTTTKEFSEKFKGNKKKGFSSKIPKTKEDNLQAVYDKINKQRNKEGKYDAMYYLKEDNSKMKQEEITKLINESNISEEIKSEYKSALSTTKESRSSVKAESKVEKKKPSKKKKVVSKKGEITTEERNEIDSLFGDINPEKTLSKKDIDTQVKNAKDSLKEVGSDVEIIISETEAQYKKDTKEGRNQNSGGTYVDGKIYINPARANKRTVAHEVFHALLLSKGTTDRRAKEITDRMLKAVKKTASKELLAEIKDFSKKYEDSLQSEESIAELFGILADGYPSLSKPQKNIIKKWLDMLAKSLGLKPFTDTEVIDFLNTVSRKVAEGESITNEDIGILEKRTNKLIQNLPVRKQISDSRANSFTIFENPKALNPKRMTNGRTKVLELGKAFDKKAKDEGYYIPRPKGDYTNSQLKQIATAMSDDAELQLRKDDSGIGWYDIKTKSAMELMSRLHPELSKQESDAHLRFTLLTAIISQNNTVTLNFKEANRAYSYYKENGNLPDRTYPGKSGNIIKENISKIFKIIDEIGHDEVKTILKKSDTVSNWKKQGYLVSSELVTTEVTGAMAILGSKIGSFWGNLNGDFGTLTADLWFTRMFNRYTGNTVAKSNTENSKKNVIKELKKYKGSSLLYGHEKGSILKGGEVFNEWINDLQKVLSKGGWKDKHPLNTKANTHFKNESGQLQDVPRGGRERKAMRDVTQLVQEELINRGFPKLDIADIQAIVWYNEKDLYKEFKAVNAKSEKQDYETAAQEVLKGEGVNSEVALQFKRSVNRTNGERDQSDAIQFRGIDEEINKVRKQKTTVEGIIEKARGNNLRDAVIKDYLVRTQGMTEAEAEAALNPTEEIIEDVTGDATEELKRTETNKQSFTARSFMSENLNKASKEKLESLGIDYEVESQDLAQVNAEKIINELGILNAYKFAKDGQIRGAARTWIMAQMFEDLNQQVNEAQQNGDMELTETLADELGSIMKEFANEKTMVGQELAMLNRIYQRFDMKYDLDFAKTLWSKKFKNEMTPEQEAKLKIQEEKINKLKEEEKSLIEKIGNLEESEAIQNIDDVIKRHKKGKPSESALKRAASALRKAKFTKSINDLSQLKSDMSGVVTGLFDSTIEMMAFILESGGSIEQAIKKGVREIKSSEWYKSLSKKNRIIAEKTARSNFEEFLNEQVSLPEAETDIDSGAIKVSPKLIYSLVEGGIDNINDLTDAVYEEIKGDYSNLTKREVRDAITGYGQQLNETKDEIKTKIASFKKDGKQYSALEDLSDGRRPKRSGRKGAKLTDKQRARIRKIKEMLKNLPIDDSVDLEAFYKTALDGYKTRLENRIRDLGNALEKNKRIVKEKTNIILDEDAKRLIAKKSELQEEYDNVFGKVYKSDETLINEIARRKKEQLNDLEKKLAYAKEKKSEQPKTTKRTVSDPKIDRLNEDIQDKRDELGDVLEEIGVAESKRLDRAKKYANKRIEELQGRVKSGDFSKRKPKTYKYDEELIDIKRKLIFEKTKHDMVFEKQEFQELGHVGKGLEYAYRAFGTFKGLKATADLSAMFRQGILLGSSNPANFAKATVDMHKFAFSNKNYKNFMAEVESSDDFIYMKEDGLSITDTSGDVLRSEERFVGNLITNIPVIGKVTDASERAYGGFLNSLRISVYRKLVKKHEAMGFDRQSNPKLYKNIAKFVNNSTGRGDLSNDKTVAKLFNALLFSPRMITGMIGVVRDIGRKDSTPYLRMQAVKSLATFVGYQYIMKQLIISASMLLLGDDDDDFTQDSNPVSTDFNKLVKGSTRYDLSAGWGIALRTLARVFYGEKSKGIEYDNQSYDDIYTQTRFTPLLNFMMNKMSPLAAQTYKFATNQHPTEFRGDVDDADVLDYLEALLVPLTITELMEGVGDDEISSSQVAFDTLLTIYGIGVQRYDNSKKEKKAAKTKSISERNKSKVKARKKSEKNKSDGFGSDGFGSDGFN